MAIPQSLQVPYKDTVVEQTRYLSYVWTQFFKTLKDIVDPLGIEKSFNLLNNQSTPVKISGLRFNNKQIASFCDYVIQRITSTTEVVECGTFKVIYKSDSQTFSYTADPGMSSNVTLSINNDGEMFYTSSNNAGTQETFKLSVRQRYLTGGNLL